MSPSPFRPLYTSRPGSQIETLEMITTLPQGATLAPSWCWYRYLVSNRRCLHPVQLCSKSSKIIMHSRDYIIAQSQHDKTAISPLLIQSLGWAETCCFSSWWSAPPPLSSTNMFQLMFVNSFLCSFLTNQFYSVLCKYFKIFVLLKKC